MTMTHLVVDLYDANEQPV